MVTDRPRSQRTLRLFLASAVLAATASWVYAFVHDGKSFAIEAALPQLELKERPFILREAWWNGELAVGKTKIIQHQLFLRNEYWFWFACSEEDSEVSIHIYDTEGKLADAEAWKKRNVAAVRVVPSTSGTYYLRIGMEKAPMSPAEWAVIYAYR